jgi:hypothetical protein
LLSIEQLRRADPALQSLSDEKVEALRDALYDTAQIAFEAWWEEKGGSNNPVGLSPDPEERPTI